VLFLQGSFSSWDYIGEKPTEIYVPNFIRPKVGKEFLKEIRRWQLNAANGAISDANENMLL